jgi:AraC-like DNA-binding protein
VATNWGFTDTSRFFRTFVRFYGVSPSGYRRNILAEQERISRAKKSMK